MNSGKGLRYEVEIISEIFFNAAPLILYLVIYRKTAYGWSDLLTWTNQGFNSVWIRVWSPLTGSLKSDYNTSTHCWISKLADAQFECAKLMTMCLLIVIINNTFMLHGIWIFVFDAAIPLKKRKHEVNNDHLITSWVWLESHEKEHGHTKRRLHPDTIQKIQCWVPVLDTTDQCCLLAWDGKIQY